MRQVTWLDVNDTIAVADICRRWDHLPGLFQDVVMLPRTRGLSSVSTITDDDRFGFYVERVRLTNCRKQSP